MKTPVYVRQAIQRYEQGFTTKALRLHKEKDKDLIDEINADPEPFSQLVKRLLRMHYQTKND